MKTAKVINDCTLLLPRIAAHDREGEKIAAKIESLAPFLVERLCAKMSLRAVARACKLSPTYLSQVRNRKVVVSRGAFEKLARFESRGTTV